MITYDCLFLNIGFTLISYFAVVISFFFYSLFQFKYTNILFYWCSSGLSYKQVFIWQRTFFMNIILLIISLYIIISLDRIFLVFLFL